MAQDHIAELEQRIAEQERMIADLNEMVGSQWRKIDAPERRIGELREEFDAASLARPGAPEPPPPITEQPAAQPIQPWPYSKGRTVAGGAHLRLNSRAECRRKAFVMPAPGISGGAQGRRNCGPVDERECCVLPCWIRDLVIAVRIVAAMLVMLALQPAPVLAASGSYADITVDRSTPERNLKTFFKAAERTILRLDAREWARDFYDAWLYPPVTPEQAAEIYLLKKHLLDSLDLSAFPDWRRDSAGIEVAFMLWEILKAENVSPATELRQLRPGLWSIPGTYLQIGEIASGMRTGDFVFTAETVANVPSLHKLVATKRDAKDFSPYRYFSETPGGLTPPRWAAIAYKLPEFLRWTIGSNTVLQLLITGLMLGFVTGLPLLAGRLVRDRGVRWFLQAAVAGILSSTASGVLVDDVRLSGPEATFAVLLFLAIFYGSLAGCALIVGEWIGNWLSAAQKAKDKSFDTTIIRLITRIGSISCALAIIIYGISAAGVPVYGIIAGFGVGGLAVALAAKPTLENILAGVILFMDGSIKVGDVIEAGSLSGTVEDIGMRSTRIRSSDGGLVSVTNLELADTVIKNVSKRVRLAEDQPAAAVEG
jgi:MscS family membrane protein